MKYHIERIERITPNNRDLWHAAVFKDAQFHRAFDEDTCTEAHDVAQAYCDEQNTKSEAKAPDGFAFSDAPGHVDGDGRALMWNYVAHCFSTLPPRQMPDTDLWRWLVPAVAKKETREDAVARFKASGIGWSSYEAFMRGAGFEG